MMHRSLLLPLLCLLVSTFSVLAQGPRPSNSVDTPGAGPSFAPSRCILTCSSAAAEANNCPSIADIRCICRNAQFQADAVQCIQDHCPDEIPSARALHDGRCIGIRPEGAAGPPKSLSVNLPTPTPSSEPSAAPSSDGNLDTVRPTSAGRGKLEGLPGALFGTVLAGAIVAGGLVL
ncbi:hypothetical protein FA15DRAFT_758705 [Coprinopsis marcescibilis]|uniref:CFEM domain-containing protein n=1 Tax=Coprinopsis marcescibilis TaxID=230819 RepID=A0A5C3KM77_COPMA|nr:hypothetical protein FA15DRAFT_758705 [Coprinopsis marcescibilis]